VDIKDVMSITMIMGMGGVEGDEEVEVEVEVEVEEGEGGVRVGEEGGEVEVDDNDYVNLVEYLGFHAVIDEYLLQDMSPGNDSHLLNIG